MYSIDKATAPNVQAAVARKPSKRRADKFADETPHQRVLHANIARDHEERQRRKKRGNPKPPWLWMLYGLRKFFAHRYGPGPMPDGDDGALDDFRVLVNYVAMLGDRRALEAAKERWMPSLSEDVFDVMVAQAIDEPEYPDADQLAVRVGLDYATRTFLNLRAIGSTDCNKEQRLAIRREKDRVAKQVRRAADAALRPAKAPKVPSIAHTKPWLAYGRGKTWWYKMPKWQRELLGVGNKLACGELHPVGNKLIVSIADKGSSLRRARCPTGAPPPQGGSWARCLAHGAFGCCPTNRRINNL